MAKLLLIALGGAAGTLARYGTSLALRGWSDRAGFPYCTLVVNLAGCFLIGLLGGLFAQRWPHADTVRLALLVGFLGGFTTFSSYALETKDLLDAKRVTAAVAYVAVSNGVGVALVFVGWWVAGGRRI